MAIKIIYGRGGSGKSRFQMDLLVEQLRQTKRNICTNLALKVPEFNEYLEKTYPNESLGLVHRLRLLTDDETKEFWKYRGPLRYESFWDGERSVEGGDMAIKLVPDPGANGVCFLIDEAGAAGFSAQEWATKAGNSVRGVECTAYLDQQRKHGDEVIASTNGRTPGQIAKGFRDKAHEFIRCKNEYQAQWGKFRGRGRFVADHFIAEPGPNLEAFKRTVYYVDADGLANCYYTERGVGVVGTLADKGKKAKGFSIWWTIPLGIAAAAMCGLVPFGLGKIMGKVMGGKEPGVASAGKAAGQPSGTSGTEAEGAAAIVVPEKPVVSGVMMRGGEIFVGVYGEPWSRVVGNTADGRILLESGQMVDRADVLRGGKGVAAMVAKQAELASNPVRS
jgi:hypothetical protein